jgi:hypothetical protein
MMHLINIQTGREVELPSNAKKAGLDEVRRVIRDEEPVRPSMRLVPAI